MADRGSIRVTLFGATDVGQVREHNEDNLLVADLSAGDCTESGHLITRDLGERGLLLAVADGMGGAASGELASKMAVDELHGSFAPRDVVEGGTSTEEMATSLEICLKAANVKIFDKSQAESEHRGMGTTMTAAFSLGQTLAIGQVGDSRAYLLRKGKLVQVTKDQSLISQLIEDGTLTEEEADRLGGRNIILQALGVEADVTVDSKLMEILDGDVLVLCSDGLTGMVKDVEIERVVSSVPELDVAGSKLIALANDGGGKDNITVILARFEGPGLRPPMRPLEKEEAGGRPAAGFAPPEAPVEEPRSMLKPVLGFGAIIAAAFLGFLLLGGGGGDVTFLFPANGLSATLVPDGWEGKTLEITPPTGEDRVKVEGIEPGAYRLVAKAGPYDALDYSMDIGRGQADFRVPLSSEGILNIVPSMPRVIVTLDHVKRQPWEKQFLRDYEFDSTTSREIEEVPAGSIKITVAHKMGEYAPSVMQVELEPRATLDVELPELVARKGKLSLTCRVPGAVVLVLDDYGVEAGSGTMPEDGELTLDVRVGTHTLEISHPLYETHSGGKVVIEEGRPTLIDRITLRAKPGSIEVTALAGESFWLMSGETKIRLVEIEEDGTTVVDGVAPGDYLLDPTGGDRELEPKPVTVESAKQAKVRF